LYRVGKEVELKWYHFKLGTTSLLIEKPHWWDHF